MVVPTGTLKTAPLTVTALLNGCQRPLPRLKALSTLKPAWLVGHWSWASAGAVLAMVNVGGPKPTVYVKSSK